MRLLRHVWGLRGYSKSTKKLRVSFEERNSSLNSIQSELKYPLLRKRQAQIPVSRIKHLVERFHSLEHVPKPDTPEFEVRGRVLAVRAASRGLMFLDVQEGGAKIQVVMNAQKLPGGLSETESQMHELIRKGDSISAVGQPWRTKAGELSILSSMSVKLLSPALHPLLDSSASNTIRKHNRVAELKAFPEARQLLEARSSIISYLVEFLRTQDFLQVQTPHLSAQRGGATARPFETEMADGTPLYLRVAPELWLKRLVVGGLDRVFEIGNSYRNEGIDSTHNPEFTTCEFYMAFANLEDLMAISRDALVYIALRFKEEYPNFAGHCEVLSANNKWQVLDFVEELEKRTQSPLKLDLAYLRTECAKAGLDTEPSDDVPHLLDRLAAAYIEPQCEGPTFVVNHPAVMAPLAKESSRGGLLLSNRFEFYVGRREYINAYEEENDPRAQLLKLKAQDPTVPDMQFVEALEWGLPPTGGWGLGVDRLVMLLTGSGRIADVLAFGDLSLVQRA